MGQSPDLQAGTCGTLVPLYAALELTHRCNLSCVHCFVRAGPAVELTTTEVTDAIGHLAGLGTLELTFTGGEPLLRDDFFEIASFARETHMACTLMTNGTLINEAVADRIQALGFYRVAISLYGPACHDRVTGIPAIVLKGAYLADRVYPTGVRPVGDLDILVKQEDFGRVERALVAAGFAPVGRGLAWRFHAYFGGKFKYERTLGVVVSVDVHLKLGPYPYLGRVDPQRLWASAVPCDILGEDALCLCREHLLLHLCLHLFHHGLDGGLLSAYDISLVLRRSGSEIDWSRFWQEVRAWGLRFPVARSLEMVVEVTGEGLPPEAIVSAGSRQRTLHDSIGRYYQENMTGVAKYLVQYISAPGLGPKVWGLYYGLLPPVRALREIYPEAQKPALGLYQKYYSDVLREICRFGHYMAGAAVRPR